MGYPKIAKDGMKLDEPWRSKIRSGYDISASVPHSPTNISSLRQRGRPLSYPP